VIVAARHLGPDVGAPFNEALERFLTRGESF